MSAAARLSVLSLAHRHLGAVVPREAGPEHQVTDPWLGSRALVLSDHLTPAVSPPTPPPHYSLLPHKSTSGPAAPGGEPQAV